MKKNIPLGQLLLEEGLITNDQLNDALAQQKNHPGKRLGDMLIDLGYVKERDMLKVLAQKLKVPYLENPIYSVQMEAVNLVPEEILVRSKLLPLYVQNGVLHIATADPLDFYSIEDVMQVTGMDVETHISSKSEIQNAQDKILTRIKKTDAISTLSQEYDGVDTLDGEMSQEVADRIDSAPIVKLLNNIVTEAIQVNASDIHIEPGENETKVRFRVDGDLRENVTIQSNLHAILTTRIKILGGMNIAEKRIPQDGRFKFMHGISEIDMRVSSLPTIYGEKIVMRLLGTNQDVSYDLEDMDFSAESVKTIRELLHYSNGIILVTGPTGSGKTTTLYSMIKEIINPKVNIVTVEDPVEKRIDGVNQIQVNHKAGLSFAAGLRSILRQDPDIIMIGEIRDAETASIAVRASITGHLVISTLHTNDSLSSIARLVDMGVEPYLLADSIRGVLAQRLVKRICPHCKTEKEATDRDRSLLNAPNLKTIAYGAGCDHCGHTGYRGRVAVNEIFVMDQGARKLIVDTQGNDVNALRDYVRTEKMITMHDEVTHLVEQKITTVDEALRIIFSID